MKNKESQIKCGITPYFFYIKCTANNIKTKGTLTTNARIISHISNLLPFPDFFFKKVKRKVKMNHTTNIVTIIFPENIYITILGILII